jgi:hypothetical protein
LRTGEISHLKNHSFPFEIGQAKDCILLKILFAKKYITLDMTFSILRRISGLERVMVVR